MKVVIEADGKIKFIKLKNINFPFTERYGFYIGDSDIMLSYVNDGFFGKKDDVEFYLKYEKFPDYVKVLIKIHNKGETDIKEPIGFHTGVDSVMIKYPQWHDTYFPTLLRCEKTHFWGYYMNTAQNALAVATDKGVASYNIEYNKINEDNYGHRILGSDIVFIQNTDLPERHPDNLKVLKSGEVYENALYFIPAPKEEVANKLSAIAEIPVITAEKFTLEKGDFLNFKVLYGGKWTSELILPNGRKCSTEDFVFDDYGIYRLIVYCDNGKISEAMFCCRKDWDFYMYNAAREAINKPQKATTHVESFYGLFSLFLGEKYFDDRALFDKGYECFEEIMPLMFDFTKFEPVIIPARIQNTALLISLLVDIYEANPEKNLKYLKYAGGFAEYIMSVQDEKGVYRREHIHYTCVIYIAKSMLELAMAEKHCGDKSISALYLIHYESVKKAIDELTDSLDNIETEGESTLEDGMISCSA